jgi:hypothetical protein
VGTLEDASDPKAPIIAGLNLLVLREAQTMTPKPITIERSAQMTKQATIELAQRTANREGKPMAVLNLNAFSPIYVVRDWHDRFANYSGLAGHGELVARIDPVQRTKLSEEQAKIISMSHWLAMKAIKEERRRQKIGRSQGD